MKAKSKAALRAIAIGKMFSNEQMLALSVIGTISADHALESATWADLFDVQVKIVFPSTRSLTWERWAPARSFVKASDGEYAAQQFAASVKRVYGKTPTAGRASGSTASKGMNAKRWSTTLGKKILDVVEYAAQGKSYDVNATLLSNLTDAIALLVGAEKALAAGVNETGDEPVTVAAPVAAKA